MNEIEKIKSWSFEDIKKDAQMTMLLLKTYSKLYLNNRPPRSCESCMHNYYLEICRLTNEKLNTMVEKLKKTNVGKFKKFYSTIAQAHVNSDYLSDKDAINYLKHGILKETDFVKLPEGYNVKTEVPETEVPETEVPEGYNVKTEGPKTYNKKRNKKR
jgi:hypothetical protein